MQKNETTSVLPASIIARALESGVVFPANFRPSCDFITRKVGGVAHIDNNCPPRGVVPRGGSYINDEPARALWAAGCTHPCI